MDNNEGWDLIEIIGKYFNQLARQRFTESPYFGIMVDETTVRGGIDCIRA